MARMTLGDNPLVNYARNSRDEMKKVTWPTREHVVRDTIVVILISIGLALFFAGTDYVLQYGFQRLLALVS